MENSSDASCVDENTASSLLRWEVILPFIILGLLNFVTIFGNSLVIAAVITSQKLRSVTNMFIVSLAIADLLVGLTILPFSSTNEILRFWVFGTTWCSIWLAMDVWLCTASIFNLCAISLDRYLAISKPFKYPTLMSPTRGRLLVASVWVISFVICFPPLIGWNERGKGIVDNYENTSRGGYLSASKMNISSTTEPSVGEPETHNGDASNVIQVLTLDKDTEFMNLSYMFSPTNTTKETQTCTSSLPECGLTADKGYIIYSALGSFWIPMAIMSFFYWRIYRVANRTTNALKRGVITTKAGGEFSSHSTDERSMTLRVHRGGGGSSRNSSRRITDDSSSGHSALSPLANGTPQSSKRNSDRRKEENKSDFYIYNEMESPDSDISKNKYPTRVRFKVAKNGNGECNIVTKQHLKKNVKNSYLGPVYAKKKTHRKANKKRIDSKRTPISGKCEDPEVESDNEQTTNKSSGFLLKFGRKDFRTKLKKLNQEKKAAKTVGIIVGCFIVCWCPFFTVYLLGAFCEDCTPPLVFSIFFWLGYCNSAINPCIYALFSKDFRYAFKQLLCCSFEKRKMRASGFFSLLNSLRIKVSSNGSDSNSE